MTDVSVRELKNNLSQYLRRAEAGERIVVKRRGKVVASISAAPNGDDHEDEKQRKLQRLVDQGIIGSVGGKLTLPKRRYKLRGDGPSMSEMIIEDRG
ncbi:MAG: type II toxin-antitoxin system prevent-host-death family antitoxin [Dehalococcoidia bacterium]